MTEIALLENLLDDPHEHSADLADRGHAQPVHELVRDGNSAKASQQNQGKRFYDRKEKRRQNVERYELVEGHLLVSVDISPCRQERQRPKSEQSKGREPF